MSLFDANVSHIIYNRHYRNEDYNPADQPVPKHLELVSFVNQYFPTCMPNILGRHANYIKSHWDSCSSFEKLFPNNRVIGYKRCHELVLAPQKNQGYFMIKEEGKKK